MEENKKPHIIIILIVRLLGFPFVLGLALICAIRDIVIISYKWAMHGGELVVFNSKTKNTIADLFTLVEENQEVKQRDV